MTPPCHAGAALISNGRQTCQTCVCLASLVRGEARHGGRQRDRQRTRNMSASTTDAQHQVYLHTYPIPWHVINVSVEQRADYEMLMQQPLNPQYAYIGASTSLTRQLPRVMARPAGSSDHARALFFLPLSPWPLCFVTDRALRKMVKVDYWQPGQTSARGQLPPVERVMDAARFSSRGRMKDTSTYPHNRIFNHTTHTCAAYERAVRWTLEQPTWLRAPERHLWIYEFPHFLRGALLVEQRGRGCAESLHAKMALGVLLAQEDRLGDWRQARELNHLIIIPFYSPPFFEFDASQATPAEHKDLLAAESSGSGVVCHRFDRGMRGFACDDEVMRHPNQVRQALKMATARLAGGSVLSPADRFSHYHTNFLVRKAALYNRSNFCLVPPGDSTMTPRISSFIAAACIPVFTGNLRDYLPFQSLIPWADVSLSANATDLLRYYSSNKRRNASAPANTSAASSENPLDFLRAMPREEVTRMQQALLSARYHFLYRDEAPSAAHSVAHELREAFGKRGQQRNHTHRVRPC